MEGSAVEFDPAKEESPGTGSSSEEVQLALPGYFH